MALILPSHFFQQSLTEKHTHPFMSFPVSYAVMCDPTKRLPTVSGARENDMSIHRLSASCDVATHDTGEKPRRTAAHTAKCSSGLRKSLLRS